MRQQLLPIQSKPSTIAGSKGEMLTDEERRSREFEMFRTDASMTIVSAMSTFVCGLAIKVADMVRLSSKSEWRAQYGILKDYTRERDTMTAVSSICKEVRRHEASLASVVSTLTRNSSLITPTSGWSGDAGDDFMSRIDNADEEFKTDYKAIRQQIVTSFRGFKCSDPQMLYPLLNAIFMAGRYLAMARWVASFAVGFRKGEEFSPILHLHVKDPLIQLAHRMNFTDKHGHPLHFVFTDDERTAYLRQAAKRSFQIKHADNPPVLVDARQIFGFDDLVRLSWRLEVHMMELKTIDRLIAASEGHDPMYRKDYAMKHLQSGANTFEQAMVNQAIRIYKWRDVPVRMRNYIDSVNSRSYIDPRRRPKPVVGFRLKPRTDKHGNYVKDKHGKHDFTTEFIGIFNSSYEAQREWGSSWQSIRKSVTLKAVNDGNNNIWLSLDDYLSMLYNQLQSVHPDIAIEFERLIPELRVRTTNEIANETSIPQGTFSQSANPKS